MVKNTIGGKKGKMMANKRMGGNDGGGYSKLRLSQNEDEIYVCVSKVFGGGMFEALNNDGDKFRVILRGKMKGQNKRHNFVSLFSFLLIGKRTDLSQSNNALCDILFLYDSNDILALSLLPNISLHNIISFHHNHSFSIGSASDSNDLFSNTTTPLPTLSNLDIDINIEPNTHTDTHIDFNDI